MKRRVLQVQEGGYMFVGCVSEMQNILGQHDKSLRRRGLWVLRFLGDRISSPPSNRKRGRICRTPCLPVHGKLPLLWLRECGGLSPPEAKITF